MVFGTVNIGLEFVANNECDSNRCLWKMGFYGVKLTNAFVLKPFLRYN
jgi:hypothetical protein